MMRYWISSWRISVKISELCISKYTAMLRYMQQLGSKIGRWLVYSDSDLPTAYGLAKLILLVLLSSN